VEEKNCRDSSGRVVKWFGSASQFFELGSKRAGPILTEIGHFCTVTVDGKWSGAQKRH
jgi:hypothetical protein